MTKKLMILGAGLFQIPLIKKAKQLGCNVITVDYLPDNEGHRYSDHFVNCSTIDKAGVLAAAKSLNIDGILTFASDVAVETVAYVGEQLGLTTVSQQIAHTMTNKLSFRRFQQNHHLQHPEFHIIDAASDLCSLTINRNKRYIVKPADSSGSKGITQLDWKNPDLARASIENARSFSRTHSVILEEYIDGMDVTGEGFVLNNQLVACFFTRKICDGFIPVAHLIPSGMNDDIQKKLFDQAEKIFQAMGYRDGPFDFDARVSKNDSYIIEITPRLGGNGVPLAISEATDNDFLAALINYSLGQLDQVSFNQGILRPALSHIIRTKQKSRVIRLPDPTQLHAQIPSLKALYFRYRPGDVTPGLIDSSTSVGYAIRADSQTADWQSQINSLENIMDIGYEQIA